MKARTKMWLLTRLYNLGSYSAQFIVELYFMIVDCTLSLLLSFSEGLYSFSYSHYRALDEKENDRRSRTSYTRDGYGRRFKIEAPGTRHFDPINYRPFGWKNRR